MAFCNFHWIPLSHFTREFPSLRSSSIELLLVLSPRSSVSGLVGWCSSSTAQRIVKVLELAGGVMDELANPSGPRKEFINNHCREFMQLIKDIQVALRDEIKSACDYRPFEKCDYSSRVANEICCKKLEYVMSQLDAMKETMDEYHNAV
ncbi:unnamed protein product [Prunus armeniaca]|uniref:Mediator of RNA polymerase II transcription subunit 11 n=1 Tax=Prunus armeniaca TaxID=36596 RepID=A0A6J5VRP9_PRUAR|nr:unnamed protein product [Prunus armeniaca]